MCSCIIIFIFAIWATDVPNDIYSEAKSLLDQPGHIFSTIFTPLKRSDNEVPAKAGDNAYSKLVNFTVPNYNMNISGEWFILAMSTYEAQRYSEVNALANSYHLSLFMEKNKVPVKAADVIWSKTIEPWSENHERELSDPCNSVRNANFKTDSYVMKGTHCSGCVVIVNKGKLTKKDCLKRWMNENKIEDPTIPDALEQFCRIYLNISYSYPFSDTEWWYREMPRDIIVESMLRDKDGGVPSDYKIYVFAGEPVYLYITMCRECDPPINQVYHVAEGRWELTKYHYKNRQWKPDVMKVPRCWPHMVKISKMISTGIPFVRTDFYDLDHPDKTCEENVILGEMTFRPHGGNIAINYDDEFNQVMGNNAIYRYLETYPCNHNIQFDVSDFDMILFDLDDCVWSGDVQFTDSLDYTFHFGNETVGNEYQILLYPMVRPFMRCIKMQKPSIKLAVASHGPKPDLSLNALKKFRLLGDLIDEDLLVFKAALESSKDKSKIWHFREIQKKSGVPFKRIAFFDNSHKYCVEAEQLGMKAYCIRKGFKQLWPKPDEYDAVPRWDIDSLIEWSNRKRGR